MRRSELVGRSRLADFINDVWFPPDQEMNLRRGHPFLDGVDVTDQRVIYASEAAGEIRGHALRDGKPYIDPVTETVALAPPRFGVVEIYLDGEEPTP